MGLDEQGTLPTPSPSPCSIHPLPLALTLTSATLIRHAVCQRYHNAHRGTCSTKRRSTKKDASHPRIYLPLTHAVGQSLHGIHVWPHVVLVGKQHCNQPSLLLTHFCPAPTHAVCQRQHCVHIGPHGVMIGKQHRSLARGQHRHRQAPAAVWVVQQGHAGQWAGGSLCMLQGRVTPTACQIREVAGA